METTKREEITHQVSGMEMLMVMSENNPGAATVLSKMLEADQEEWWGYVLNLDDMNIRGTQIWVGYKDYCGEDLQKFMTLVKARDAKMVAHINREGVRGNHIHKAVTHGASFGSKRPLLNGQEA